MELEIPVRVGLNGLLSDFADPLGDPIALAAVRRISKRSDTLLSEGLQILRSHRELLGDHRPALDLLIEQLQLELVYQAEEEARCWLQAALIEERYSMQLLLDINGRSYHYRSGKGDNRALCGVTALEGVAWQAPRGYLTSWRQRTLGEKGSRRNLRPRIYWSTETGVCPTCLLDKARPNVAEIEAFPVLNDQERNSASNFITTLLDGTGSHEECCLSIAKQALLRRVAERGEETFLNWIAELELTTMFAEAYPDGFQSPTADDYAHAVTTVKSSPFDSERRMPILLVAAREEFDALVAKRLLPTLIGRHYPRLLPRLRLSDEAQHRNLAMRISEKDT